LLIEVCAGSEKGTIRKGTLRYKLVSARFGLQCRSGT
jgi:hypothetical protein